MDTKIKTKTTAYKYNKYRIKNEKEKFRVLNILIRELKLIYNFTHKFVYFCSGIKNLYIYIYFFLYVSISVCTYYIICDLDFVFCFEISLIVSKTFLQMGKFTSVPASLRLAILVGLFL